MTEKRPWHEFEPHDVRDTVLPNDTIQGPYNEQGEECPWPWDPIQLKGAPMGQYRCPYCTAMCIAGAEHFDYGPVDENGWNFLDRRYMHYAITQMYQEGLSMEEVLEHVGQKALDMYLGGILLPQEDAS